MLAADVIALNDELIVTGRDLSNAEGLALIEFALKWSANSVPIAYRVSGEALVMHHIVDSMADAQRLIDMGRRQTYVTPLYAGVTMTYNIQTVSENNEA